MRVAESRPVRGPEELSPRGGRDSRCRLRKLSAGQGHRRRGTRGHHHQDLGRRRRNPAQRSSISLDLHVSVGVLIPLGKALTLRVFFRDQVHDGQSRES